MTGYSNYLWYFIITTIDLPFLMPISTVLYQPHLDPTQELNYIVDDRSFLCHALANVMVLRVEFIMVVSFNIFHVGKR